ncbi:30S ribosomal protein S21 [Candidatus Margulisiibacteriota bacterium]
MVKQDKRPGESFDSFFRKFKKKMKNEGILQELKKREYFEKPSEEKKRKDRAAKRRNYLKRKADEY